MRGTDGGSERAKERGGREHGSEGGDCEAGKKVREIGLVGKAASGEVKVRGKAERSMKHGRIMPHKREERGVGGGGERAACERKGQSSRAAARAATRETLGGTHPARSQRARDSPEKHAELSPSPLLASSHPGPLLPSSALIFSYPSESGPSHVLGGSIHPPSIPPNHTFRVRQLVWRGGWRERAFLHRLLAARALRVDLSELHRSTSREESKRVWVG